MPRRETRINVSKASGKANEAHVKANTVRWSRKEKSLVKVMVIAFFVMLVMFQVCKDARGDLVGTIVERGGIVNAFLADFELDGRTIRGLASVQEARAGDILVRVPATQIMSAETVDPRIYPRVLQMISIGRTAGEVAGVPAIARRIATIAGLAIERRLLKSGRVGSTWAAGNFAAYVAALPDPPNNLPTFNDDEIAAVRLVFENLVGEFEFYWKVLVRLTRKGDLLEGISQEELRACVALTISRRFESDLIPIVDLANHEAKEELANAVFSRSGGGDAFLHASRPILRGEEIRIHYGPKSDAFLLTFYGFVVEPSMYNPHSSVKLNLNAPAGATWECRESLSSVELPLDAEAVLLLDKTGQCYGDDATRRDKKDNECKSLAKPSAAMKRDSCGCYSNPIGSKCPKSCLTRPLLPQVARYCDVEREAAAICFEWLEHWGAIVDADPPAFASLRLSTSNTSAILLAALEADLRALRRCAASSQAVVAAFEAGNNQL